MSKRGELIPAEYHFQIAIQDFPVSKKGLYACLPQERQTEGGLKKVEIFFWSCFAIFLVGSAILLFGCSRSGHPPHLDLPKPLRALWVWDAEVITDNTKQQQFFDFCGEKNISLIYLDVGDCFVEPEVKSNKVQVSKAALANFVSMAHDRSIKVHALDGDASWAYSEKHSVPLGRLQRALEFNTSVQAKESLDGFQFDIEPYLLPEFDTDKWKEILNQYLILASKLRDKVKTSGTNFELGFAIPFWWDDENPTVSKVTWQEMSKPVAYHLVDILDALPGAYIAIMDYRDFTDGSDGSIRHASDEMKYVSEYAKHVTVFIGQETGDVKDEPPKITFWQEGEAALEKAIAELIDAFTKYKCFGGIAIHHYDSLRQLKAGKEPVSVSPGEKEKKPTATDKNLTILIPKIGETVERMALVSGTAPYKKGYTVAVSVFPYGDIWYSQGEVEVSIDGTWQLNCHFGNASTKKGYKFKIRAVLLDEQNNEIDSAELDYVMRN